MNRSMALKHLWWKELRQLFPLVALLLLVGIFLLTMTLLLPGQIQWRQLIALLGMPALFAAGAGALLVGQEKELRTLDWMRSLPLAAGDLVCTKFLVAVLGLTVVWSVSLIIGLATGAWSNVNHIADSAFLWPLHSFFLLIIGFATSWKLRSSMIALLVVVPIACLPLFFAALHQWFIDWVPDRGLSSTDPHPWIMATYLIVFSVGFLWYGWRAGVAYLSPQLAPRFVQEAKLSKKRPTALSYSRTSPLPALLWQFAIQNRAALIGLFLLQVVGLLLLAEEAVLPLAVLATLLVVSWLGTLVFQGDTNQRRIVFLADRGVSPSKVWLTRQAIPLGSAVVIAPLLIVFAVYFHFEGQLRTNLSVVAIATIIVLGVYATTQWLGQVIDSPILAAILAPFVGCGISAYMFYAVSELSAMGWTVALALLIPMFATYFHTRAWMDRRTGWRVWFGHVCVLAITLLLPLTYFVYYVACYPTLTAASKQKLQSIVDQTQSSYTSGYQLSGLPEDQRRGSFEQIRNATLKSYHQQLAEHPGPIDSQRVHQLLIADAMLDRMRDERASDAEATKRYREAIDLLVQLHDRMRLSSQLLVQDQADIIEMWFVEELKSPQSRERLGEALIEQFNRIFANQESRQDARRRAIALAWKRSSNGYFGGYDLTPAQGRVTTKDVWESSRKAGLISELLLRSLDASGEELVKLKSEIARAMGRFGAESQPLYSEDGKQLLYFELLSSYVPGAYWNGPWEQQGAELAQP